MHIHIMTLTQAVDHVKTESGDVLLFVSKYVVPYLVSIPRLP